MNTATIKDKHLKLDQKKIDKAKHILGVKTETETIEKALEMVIHKDRELAERRKVVERILNRRKRLKIQGDVVELIREGREEREKDLWNSIK